MDKSKIKTNYDPIRSLVINELVKKTGYTYQFIASAAAERKVTEAAQQLRRMYHERYAEIKDALNSN